MLNVIDQVKAIISWWKERLQSVLAKSQEKATVLMTRPLSKVEYAILKRVSGLVGSTLAVYLILSSDLFTAFVLLSIGIMLACLLEKVTSGVQVPVKQ